MKNDQTFDKFAKEILKKKSAIQGLSQAAKSVENAVKMLQDQKAKIERKAEKFLKGLVSNFNIRPEKLEYDFFGNAEKPLIRLNVKLQKWDTRNEELAKKVEEYIKKNIGPNDYWSGRQYLIINP